MNYKFNAETLYEKTNKGLDIIEKYCPAAKDCAGRKKHFNFRSKDQDKTPSAIIYENDTHYFVKDWGDQNYNPIAVCMFFTGWSFYEALRNLYQEFGLAEGNFFRAETTFESTDLPLGHFEIIENETFQNIDVVGRFLDEETAAEYDFVSVKEYSFVVTLKATGKTSLCRIKASETFPIYAYCPVRENGKIVQWAKIYQPADKKYKHSFVGKKPKKFVFGLARLQKKYDAAIADFNNQIEAAKKDDNPILVARLIEERDKFKLDSVFNCSGGSDGLSTASLNYNVIWHNSETEHLDFETYSILKKICYKIYNLPDIDAPGIKAAYANAEKFWNIYTIYLPESLKKNGGKDLRDWIKKYSQNDKKTIQYHFENLIQGALRMKFFDKRVMPKTKAISYKLRFEFLCYFLNIKGFYTYEIEQKNVDNIAPEQVIFVKIEGNIVKKVSPRIIRSFAKQFLREKGQPIEVLELISMSTVFNENNLLTLTPIKLDFTNNTPQSQFFFFKNKIAEITNSEIRFHDHGKTANFVWDYSVKDHEIKPEEPFFKITVNDLGEPSIEILRKDSEFLNFLTNASRVFWRKELEEPFGQNATEKEKYHNENRFAISSMYLSEEENKMQNQHLCNKIYALGYLAHRYKQMSFSKIIVAIDDKQKELEEDANGGSGKTLIFRGLNQLLTNYFPVDGKNPNFTTDKHLLQGFTKENDYMLIQDGLPYFDFNHIYNWVDDNIPVNPKFGSPYMVTQEEAGKIAFTTNYGIRNFIASTKRRVFFITTSDYYHVKTDEYFEERKVSDDFNGNDLFSSWDVKQKNIHFNLMMQMCQAYLQFRNYEFTAPSNNLEINNMKANLGDAFITWAEGYFTKDFVDTENENQVINGTLDRFILKRDMYDSYVRVAQKGAKNSTKWKKNLKDWCKSNGYVLNPKVYLDKNGLIKKAMTDEKGVRQVLEHFYIETPKIEPNTDVDI